MPTEPTIDGRDETDILSQSLERAPYYVPEWEAAEADFGTALLRLHAALAGDVAERADRLVEKHRAAFIDTLGFERAPPSPSRVAVSVAVTPSASTNVPIPAETRIVATGLDGGERTFEVDESDAFEATPARLGRVFSVAPRTDAIYNHTPAGSQNDAAGPPRELSLFSGENRQEHALYLGDDDLLTVAPGSLLRLLFTTQSPPELFRDCLTWEYYGVETDADGSEREDWHPLDSRTSERDRRHSVRAAARRLATRVADRRPTYEVREMGTADGQASLTAVAAAVREWFADRSPRTEGVVVDGLLPRDATDEDRSVAVEELRSLDAPADRSAAGGRPSTVTLDFTVEGEPTPTTVAGVESKWIRGRFPDGELLQDLFSVSVSDPSFRVLTRGTAFSGGIRPDTLLSGVSPLAIEAGESFHPFGPTPQDTFYIASSEAFTKREERVTLGFTYADDDDTDDRGIRGEIPRLSWEYWDGVGWTRLPGVTDGTSALKTEGTVSFTVPNDFASTSVVGREGYWIRARLVEGAYVRTTYTQLEETTEAGSETETTERTIVTKTTGSPPKYGDLRITYNARTPVSHVVTHNNLQYRTSLGEDGEPIRPFSGVPDNAQTVYLGFDGPLTDGPISVLFDSGTREYPAEFRPRLRWERCVDPRRDEWTVVDATDRTVGLTERGTVRLLFEDATVPSERFGTELHWLRARFARDEFAVSDDPLLVRRDERLARDASVTEGDVVVPERTGERLVAGDRTAGRTTAPPTLGGIYSNTGWARDVRTIRREVLGSSDGSEGQTFAASTSPVLEGTVWVDEFAALSVGRQEDVAASRSDDVESVTGPDGAVREFWVRWTHVPTLLDSTATDRHYTLDAVAGEIQFGDGTAGRIPPRGRENVRMTYRTGGGAAGNVSAGAVTGLTSAIPLVESVTNWVPADGGSDEESNAEVIDRAPGAIRDRGRVVSAADLERITEASSPRVARAKCLSGLGPSGELTPGWVTLVVVPDSRDRKPVPSRELRRQVRDALHQHVPASLLTPGRERLLVRGPNFVTVSVEADVVGVVATSVSTLERRVTESLNAFLNPLTGGPGGTGWWFGELPSLSELYAMLEHVDGVDHVERLSVTYRGSERDVTVTEGEPLPTVASDVLAFSGTHDVTATGGF